MLTLLVLLIAILTISDAFGFDLSLAPGLSIKNAMLYSVALVLALRMIIRGGVKIDLAGVQVCFAVWIAYAMLTWLIVGLVAEYPGYKLVSSGISLKSRLIDHAIFYVVFFYAIYTLREAVTVTKALVGALALTSLMTLVSVFGGVDIGVKMFDTEDKYGERVLGVFGNPNWTGAFIVSLLPANLALAYRSRGRARFGWLIGALLAFAVLVSTVSRGAFVGLIIGGIWALILCRNHVPMRRAVIWLTASLVVTAPIVALVSMEFGDLLKERFVSQSGAVDMGDVSSGRTDIWSTAIARMMSMPHTLITGFGWDAYDSMAFRYAPHSHYLWLWFELGLIGIGCFLLIVRHTVVAARRALDSADDETRPFLIASIFSLLSLSVILLFGNLAGIWLYLWAYIGVSMRIVCIARTMVAEGATRSAQDLSRAVAIGGAGLRRENVNSVVGPGARSSSIGPVALRRRPPRLR